MPEYGTSETVSLREGTTEVNFNKYGIELFPVDLADEGIQDKVLYTVRNGIVSVPQYSDPIYGEPVNGFSIVPKGMSGSRSEYYAPTAVDITVPSGFTPAGVPLDIECDFAGMMNLDGTRRYWTFTIPAKVFMGELPEVPDAPVITNITATSFEINCPNTLKDPVYTHYEPIYYDPMIGEWISAGEDCFGGEVITVGNLSPNTFGYRARFVGVFDPSIAEPNQLNGVRSPMFRTEMPGENTDGSGERNDEIGVCIYPSQQLTLKAVVDPITPPSGTYYVYQFLEDGVALEPLSHSSNLFIPEGFQPQDSVDVVYWAGFNKKVTYTVIVREMMMDEDDACEVVDSKEYDYTVFGEEDRYPLGKVISESYRGRLAESVTTRAVLMKITRKDGRVFAYTTSSRSVDGNEILQAGLRIPELRDTVFKSTSGVTPSSIANSLELSEVSSLDIEALIKDDEITLNDLRASLFDGAQVLLCEYDYENPGFGIMRLKKGYIGQVEFTETSFTGEVISLAEKLKNPVLDEISTTCRVKQFGDAQCGVDLDGQTADGFDITKIVLVDSVDPDDPTWRFSVDGISDVPDKYYDYGRITCIQSDSPNRNVTRKIKKHTQDGLELSETFPYPLEVGDSMKIVMGCDRTIETCIQRYNNAHRFRGEPYVPGVDLYTVE